MNVPSFIDASASPSETTAFLSVFLYVCDLLLTAPFRSIPELLRSLEEKTDEGCGRAQGTEGQTTELNLVLGATVTRTKSLFSNTVPSTQFFATSFFFHSSARENKQICCHFWILVFHKGEEAQILGLREPRKGSYGLSPLYSLPLNQLLGCDSIKYSDWLLSSSQYT